MGSVKIEVRSHAGVRGDERPLSFECYGERVEVVQILRMWIEQRQTGEGIRRYFRVRGSDGFLHTLYFDEREQCWFLG